MAKSKKKNPWLAGILNFIFPGVGYLYLKKRRVFALSIRITNRCQLSCNYCNLEESKKDIDLDSLFDFLSKRRRQGLFYIILTGGEPYLHPEFSKLYDFLKKQDFYIVMNTNGYGIYDSTYRRYLINMDEIVVSIDGNQRQHDSMRGKGSYKRAIKTLAFLKKNRKKVVLSTVLNSENTNAVALEEFLNLKEKYDAILDFSVVSPNLFGEVDKDTFSDKKDLKRFIDILMRLKKKRTISQLSFNVLDYLINPKRLICRSIDYALYINVDGNIYPCIYAIGNKSFLAGSISEDRFYDIKYPECRICYCQSLIALNLMLENRYDLKSFLRWIG